MGIQVEFNPDLALRDHSEFEKGKRQSASQKGLRQERSMISSRKGRGSTGSMMMRFGEGERSL